MVGDALLILQQVLAIAFLWAVGAMVLKSVRSRRSDHLQYATQRTTAPRDGSDR